MKFKKDLTSCCKVFSTINNEIIYNTFLAQMGLDKQRLVWYEHWPRARGATLKVGGGGGGLSSDSKWCGGGRLNTTQSGGVAL